jgi:hypothetical protein
MILDKLRAKGFAYAPPLSTRQIAEVNAFLYRQDVFNGHVIGHSDGKPMPWLEAARRNDWPTFCVTLETALATPYLFEHALAMLPLVRDYFDGERPLLYGINVFWTQPSQVSYRDTHDWHRDPDDEKQLAMFVYGEDVLEPAHGAHLYQADTRMAPPPPDCNTRLQLEAHMHKQNATLGLTCAPERVITVLGPAGTTFLSDPSGVHMGIRPNKLRMLAWMRWGTHGYFAGAPTSKDWLGDRYPSDPELQQSLRRLVQ